MRLKIFIAVALVMAALALPAWGADTATSLHAYTPPPGDVSVDFLHQVFGTAPDGVGVGGSGTMLSAMMPIYLNAVLFLTMIFVAYTTVIGTVNSAHDGVLLGKTMSEVWVPIRTVAGSAILLPLGSGFCLIQVGVLWLAVQGVAIADLAWTVGMNEFAKTGTLGEVSLPDARPLAAAILRSEVCAEVMNKQYADTGRPDRIQIVKQDELPSKSSIYYQDKIQLLSTFHTSTTYLWQNTARPAGPSACGSVAFQQSSQDKLTADLTNVPRERITQAQADAVAAMIKELQPTAQQIALGHHRPQPGVIEQAALRYSRTVASTAKAAVDASPDVARAAFIKEASTGGWIYAGTWFNSMLKLNDTIQSAANAVPISSSPRVEDLEVDQALISYKDTMALLDEYLKDRSASPRRAYEESLQDAKSLRSSDDVWRLLSVPAMSALDGITQRISGANTSPLMQLHTVGNDIIGAGFAIKATMFTLAGFAGSRLSDLTIGNVFNLSDALKTTTGSVEFLAAGLWGLGALLAYYLPSIPTFLWLVAVIRWLASVAEAVLASPLMASFVVHPSGDQTVGRAGPGLMLILAVTFQPILLVLGFVISALMIYLAGWLVNSMFIGMVSSTTDGTVMGPIGLIAWCSVYVAMMVLAMHACFALVQAVPDNVMHFIGTQAGAQNIGTSQTDKSTGGMERNADSGGNAAGRFGTGNKPDAGGAGKAPRAENGFSNADLM